MGLIQLLLLILGVAALIVGVLRLVRYRAWVDGIVLVVIGLILLGVGGFVHIDL